MKTIWYNAGGMKELRRSKILEAAYRLAQRRGEEVFLVGGAVRDRMLGKTIGNDLDLVVPGDVRAFAEELGREVRGHAFLLDEFFNTWRVVRKQGKKKVEVDLCRLQSKDIIEDLRQRDFTANSLAVRLEDVFSRGEPAILDPLNGLADLRQKLLRVNSEESFRRDPLRMLRAFRLASCLDFRIEDETAALILKHRELIRSSAGERIRAEFFAALNETRADSFLRGLHRCGLLEEIFPETAGWESLQQESHHEFPLLEHALRTVAAAERLVEQVRALFPDYAIPLERFFAEPLEEGISRRALFKFAAFLHDSGKPRTRAVAAEGQVRFLDHDQEGEKVNLIIGRRMKLSRRSVRILMELTRHHMRILSLARLPEITSRAKYRFFRDLGGEGVTAIFLFVADRLAHKEIDLHLVRPFAGDVAAAEAAAVQLLRYYYEQYAVHPPAPLLDGREIMEALGVPEGERVGMLLEKLREAEIAGVVRTKEDALTFLKNVDRLSGLG